MAHTNSWSDTIPLGSTQAKEIDNHIRQARLDIRERMNDFVVDWTADPVVPKGIYGGAVTGKERYFHPTEFKGDEIMDDESGLYVEDRTSGASQLYAPVQLQAGSTISSLSFIINVNGGGAITGRLSYNVYSTTPSTVVVATVTSNTTTGIQLINPSAFSHVIVTGRVYYLHVTLAGSSVIGSIGSRFYGARIVYNCDNASQVG